MRNIMNMFVIMCSILFRILAISSAQNVPAFFIFGDSMVDAGNNFYIDTLATPGYPNGIDFPKGTPSGRYTNSRMISDIIGEELGFQDYTPPFLAPNTTGDVILKGVNYASSGAGILQATGAIFGERIYMDKQLDYFAKTRQDIITRIGAPAAQALLRNSLYFLVIGDNDILNGEVQTIDSNTYTDQMVSTFKSQITRLYNMDARKLAVFGVSKVGHIPFELDVHICGQACVESVNNLAVLFNSKLKILLGDLSNSLPGSIFVYVDNDAITDDIINNYRSYGFETMDYACCEVIGRHGGLVPCVAVSRVCSDRTKYVFWDPFHPTESAVLIATRHILDGGPEYVSPINLRQLVNI